MHSIYLDYAATTPLLPEVFEAMKPYYFQHYGNASSLHAFGLRARQAVEHSRQSIAEVLGTEADNIIFTSGGTESNNLALQGIVSAVGIRPAHIITSAIEHSSVLNVCGYLEQQGHAISYIPVSSDGIVDPLLVEAAIRPNTVMISIQHANSEIGTLQPIDHIRRIALCHNIIFHTDAVQTFGKMQPPAVHDGISLLSSSAHKLYGPKGIGCLYINRADICMKMLSRPDLFPDPPETMLRPLMFGGEQEMGLRPSTENVPAIAGFGAAAAWARRCMDSEAERLRQLREHAITRILQQIPDTSLNGSRTERLPNNINICFRGANAYEMVLLLDRCGIACSSGTACASWSEKPSRVLTAIGRSSAEALSSLRLTLGRHTTREDLDAVVEQLPAVMQKLAAMTRN